MAKEEFQYEESIKDELEDFFSSPSKDGLPAILEADKEYNYLDFKSEWYEKSKLARHILAFSNSGGGAMIVGVEETDDGLQSAGVDDTLDDADFGDKIEKYLPEAAHDKYNLRMFRYGEDVYDDGVSGKDFQVLFIEGADEKAPLVAANEGSNIDEGSIYIRRNTKSVDANYEEIQSLLRNRHEAGVEKETAELHEELRQLKTLYNEIDKKQTYMTGFQGLSNVMGNLQFESKKNPNFPSKDYEEFVAEMIDKKQKRIEQRLGVQNIAL